MKIEFKPNYKKILQSILFCIKQNSGTLNQYNLMKIIFAADKYHLNKYGRPVTGDRFIRMEHGTVPSIVRDITNLNKTMLAKLDILEFPFKKEKHYLFYTEEVKLEFFSKSDIEALKVGINEYSGLTFTEVRNKNHSEKCWVNKSNGETIPFEMMISNKDILAALQEDGSDITI